MQRGEMTRHHVRLSHGRRSVTSLIRIGITALLALGVVVGTAGTSRAGFLCVPCTVQIDDLTDTPTVKVFQPSPFIDVTIQTVSNLQRNGELLSFNLGVFSGQTPGARYFDLFEDHVGGTLSDRILLDITVAPNSPFLFLGTVTFASDPSSLVLPLGAVSAGGVVEDGTFQTVNLSFGAFTIFQVRSDAPSSERGDVPAPATLLLLGAGVAGMAAIRWNRPRRP